MILSARGPWLSCTCNQMQTELLVGFRVLHPLSGFLLCRLQEWAALHRLRQKTSSLSFKKPQVSLASLWDALPPFTGLSLGPVPSLTFVSLPGFFLPTCGYCRQVRAAGRDSVRMRIYQSWSQRLESHWGSASSSNSMTTGRPQFLLPRNEGGYHNLTR